MEMNEKITQTFIDSLTALVPDGWRLIDYRPCPEGHDRLSSCGNTVMSARFNITNNCLLVEKIPMDQKHLTGLAFIESLLQGTRVETKGGIYFRLITSFVRCDNEVYATWATSNKWSWHEGRKLADLSADTCKVYPSIVKPEPLTGQAWAEENIVTRPGSHILLNGIEYNVGPKSRISRFPDGEFCRYDIVLREWKYWEQMSELDGLSDETVEWLYKAPEKTGESAK